MSMTESVPARGPVAVGVNVTLIVQVAPAFNMVPQLGLLAAKSPVVGNEIVVLAVPVFFTVTALLALVVFSACGANVSVAGVTVTVTVPELPVPVRLTV